MRVTQSMMVSRLMSSIQRTQQGMARLQDRMATGRRVLVPRDDPAGTGTIMRMKTNLTEIERYKRASEDALGWLSFTESTVQRAGDLIHNLRELTIQAAAGSVPEEARQNIAQEIKAIQQTLLDLANSSYDGRYAFSGHMTGTAPFSIDDDGSVLYHGDSGQQVRNLGPGMDIAVNIPGDEVFTSLLELSGQLASDVAAGNVQTLSEVRLDDLDAELDRTLVHIGAMGARYNRVSLSLERALDLELAFTTLMSQVEDADFARTITDLSLAETVYQAALSATSRVLRPGLHEYLR